MSNLNYLIDHISYQIFNSILILYQKKHGEKTVNPSIRIYISKIEKKITFRIKPGYYLELVTREIMKLLGSTKSKITKVENSENVSYLEISEVV